MYGLSRRAFLSVAAGFGSLAGLSLVSAARASDRPTMPVPPELRADSSGSIALRTEAGTGQFLPGITTPTYGINGPFLGPAIRVRRGDQISMNVTNGLDENTTMHWHGLKIPGDVDGSPYTVIKPGDTWRPTLNIDQPAATCWFHPHFYPTTAEQVIKGLAGLFIIDDDETDTLGLPSRWGVDDIPIIIQDRRFNSNGTFFHRFNLAAVTTGYVGDTMLVNGAHDPVARTARGWLRLRLLNGSNARTYRLAASDRRSMFVIAGDGGLLAEPVELKELTIYSGERYEVMVDARDGVPFDMMTLPVDQMAMSLPPFHAPLRLVTVNPEGVDIAGALPDTLVEVPPLVKNQPPVSQELVMEMNMDDQGMGAFKAAGLMEMTQSGKADPNIIKAVNNLITDGPALPLKTQLSANAVNGQPFELGTVPFSAPLKTDLRWKISEGTDSMYHPVHIHGCQFRILELNGAAVPAHMAGWKDIAPVLKGGSCTIQIRFDHPAGKEAPFMAHCHNLEHEDSGMMTNFTVG
ncbi:multicopper oxidase CueO [Hoeflea poritis]|uniref:Multicopper oxidase CueO n=1 Tax=Hoeflea poritis TaxID=2993659 RepID=A0ABT4VK85_9HYPH|nr:multicopper oxidase CueO [Hoeflea poritis]MDA4845131.1 multicopper oxidase CueO [Hoeflea poritis]